PKKLKKHSRRKWELREELDFLEAVELYGAGNWQKMLGHGCLTNRTAVNLKDKWRNILK
ncbi:hypothetical protein HELRODRAFT_137690, partial [Helobdella robusta]|uniref:Uncharacterized protein n=1 Tax=Helobdella robusta TaxID=6412 RepID=T1EIM8_HELRO